MALYPIMVNIGGCWMCQVNNMKLTEDPGDEEHLRFTLTDKSPGADLALVCHALNEELRQTWVSHIKSLLDMQGHFLRGILRILKPYYLYLFMSPAFTAFTQD